MEPIRVGIVGFGFRAEEVARTLANMPQRYEVAAACDVRPVRLEAARNLRGRADAAPPPRLALALHEDYRELLKDESLRAVFVMTPQDSHAGIALDALSAGKDVYCEKPMALTTADCDDMIAAAEAAGRVLMVGQQMRYSAHLQRMSRLLREGAIGEPAMMWIRELRNPFPATMRWAFEKKRSGGTLVEKSCHHFDVFNWFAGARPVRVHAVGGARVHGEIFGVTSDVADHAVVTVQYENRCVASYVLCMFAGAPHEHEYGLGYHHREIAVMGTAGLLRTEGWDLGRQRIEQRSPHTAGRIVHELTGQGQRLTPYNQDGNIGVFWEFHECVTQGRRPLTDGRVGRDALAVSLAAEQSLAEGRPVAVSST